MMKIILASVLVTCLIATDRVNAQENNLCLQQCKTPQGLLGACVGIRSCKSLLKLIPAARDDQRISGYLKQSGCGFDQYGPKVCCPVGHDPSIESNTDTSEPIDNRFQLPNGELQQCGNRSNNLRDHGGYAFVGGADSKQGQWPWVAALGYRHPAQNTTSWLCGGALITKRHVLTAAHCVVHRADLYVVRLGEFDFGTDLDSAIDIKIAKAVPHEEYNRKTRIADIAVIYLQEDAPYTFAIYPVCLPYAEEVATRNFTTTIYQDYPWGAGWGATQYQGASSPILQDVRLPVVTTQECQDAYQAFPNQIIDDRVICAGFKQGGKDACSGDSGGPLFWPMKIFGTFGKRTIYYLIGVVSYGYRCAELGFPGVYTRVSSFMPWIMQKLQQ